MGYLSVVAPCAAAGGYPPASGSAASALRLVYQFAAASMPTEATSVTLHGVRDGDPGLGAGSKALRSAPAGASRRVGDAVWRCNPASAEARWIAADAESAGVLHLALARPCPRAWLGVARFG